MLGRTFAADEGPEGHDDFAVLSYEFWQRRFGGDAGRHRPHDSAERRHHTVVGVMPPDTRIFLKRWSLVGKPTDLWKPFAFTEASRQPRGRYMSAIGRLKPGVTIGEAQAQLNTIAAGLADGVSAVRHRLGCAARAAAPRARRRICAPRCSC